MKKCSTTEETYTVIEKKGQSINIERESDMQENINFIVAIVTSLITMCTLIYNTFFKGGLSDLLSLVTHFHFQLLTLQ